MLGLRYMFIEKKKRNKKIQIKKICYNLKKQNTENNLEEK